MFSHIGRLWVLFGIGLVGWSLELRASELAYGAGYYGTYSDNVRRTSTNPQSEWIHSLIAGLGYRENGPALQANAQLQAEYRDYKYDTYRDGPLYFVDASLLWKIFPERLEWFFVDRYDQVTRDSTLANTPDNLVDANVLSTGPNLFLRFGNVNTLLLGLRYGNASYNDDYPSSNVDNSRYGALVRWLYRMNSATTNSLNYEFQRIKYDEAVLNGDFDKHDLYMRIDWGRAFTQFLLDLGATRVDVANGSDESGHLARLTWSQTLTSESSAGVQLADEYLDSGSALLATATSSTGTPGAPPSLPVANSLVNDFFYTKRADVYYDRKGDSGGMKTRIFYRDIDYRTSSFDRHEIGGHVELSYVPFGLLTTTAYFNHTDIEYQSPARNDRDNDIGIRLLFRLSRHLTTTLDAQKAWRFSSDPASEYTDRRILFSLAYSSASFFVPVRAR